MEGIYQWGIDVIQRIHQFESPTLTVMMRGLTVLGSVYTYLGLIPLIYWCIDEKKGFRLGFLLIFSTWVNIFLKVFFKQPRPFELDPRVGRAYEETYGFPSGHAQTSLVVWMIFASWGKRNILYLGGLVISLLIGFSRLYLGVHFPTDLFGGWFLAFILLGVYFFLGGYIESLLLRGGLRLQMILASGLALLINVLSSGTGAIHTTLSGTLFGMGIGYSLMVRYILFSAKISFPGKKGKHILFLALRFLLGVIGLALLFLGLTLLIPGETSVHFRLANFCRFAILGIWIYAGAPWVFLRLGLAEAGKA
jgi:membrane-associated phospholipid phosphatase